MSTTRLGLQRSNSNINTYVPRTLPKRLYKRAQLEVDDNANSCYKLTTQDALITAAEIEAVLAVDKDNKAIDKAIKTIKRIVKPSRNRVLTA
jgi:hypothetical protein